MGVLNSARGTVREAARLARRADEPATGTRKMDFLTGAGNQLARWFDFMAVGRWGSIWMVLGGILMFDFLVGITGQYFNWGATYQWAKGVVS